MAAEDIPFQARVASAAKDISSDRRIMSEPPKKSSVNDEELTLNRRDEGRAVELLLQW
jgi:hypothetical protein